MAQKKVEWVLGLDVGQYKTGVAVGQTLLSTATPLAVVQQKITQLSPALFSAYIEQWRVSAIVLGMPEHADATPHPLASAIRALGDKLQEAFSLPIYYISEYLSSHEAKRRSVRSSKMIDDLAAAVILETWLSQQSNMGYPLSPVALCDKE